MVKLWKETVRPSEWGEPVFIHEHVSEDLLFLQFNMCSYQIIIFISNEVFMDANARLLFSV